MADQIQNYLIKAYTDLVILQAQQIGSKVLPYCSVKNNVRGESAAFGYLGSADMVAKPSRHAPTPNQDVTHQQRWATLAAYHGGFGLDETDDEAAFTSPKSDYVMIGRQAFARKWDNIILSAARSNATFGASAGSTETWSTYTDRNAESRVVTAAGGVPNLADILKLKRIFWECDIYDDLHAFVSPQFMEKWLNVTEVKSADYNSIKALVQGELNTFAGFEWHITNQLYITGTTRSNIFMQRNAMGVAFSVDQKVRIAERADLSFAWWSYFETCLGAVRRDSERVIEYTFTES